MGKRLTNEQRKAFAGMLQPHHEYLARFCAHLARTDEDGQDLYQQAILKALVKLGSLREDGRFRQWMCSIIVNEHRSRCRSRRSHCGCFAGSSSSTSSLTGIVQGVVIRFGGVAGGCGCSSSGDGNAIGSNCREPASVTK